MDAGDDEAHRLSPRAAGGRARAPWRTASSIAFSMVGLFARIHCETEPESSADTWKFVVGWMCTAPPHEPPPPASPPSIERKAPACAAGMISSL